MARYPTHWERRAMAVEHKIRSVGHKGITYPWMRRYVIVGPYNKHYRRDAIASLVASFIVAGSQAARKRRRKRSNKTG